jgi:hypothetical protein
VGKTPTPIGGVDHLHRLITIVNITRERSWYQQQNQHIFKKGDPSVLDNYRGIAVGSVIGKLFSLVLHSRLDAWAEACGKRADGQAGFRDGK